MPDEDEAAAVTSRMVRYEAAQVHRKWLDDPSARYGADVRARLEEGLSITESEYQDARARREVLTDAILTAHRVFDAVAGPTVPITAPAISTCVQATGNAVQTALLSNTYCFNVTGQPAISVPCGLTPDGLPAGLQLAAGPGRDHTVLDMAVALQRVTTWHTARPVPQRSAV